MIQTPTKLAILHRANGLICTPPLFELYLITPPALASWRVALQHSQLMLHSIRNMITYPGAATEMQIWYVEDANSDVESSDITHVTNKDYGSSVVFEPYPCTMPGCEEQFDNGTTVLQFYIHMEEATHANWLFGLSNHNCSFGCEKGFLNAHSLLRHYLSGGCQRPTTGDIPILHTPSYLGHEHELACESYLLVFPDGQTPWTHCTDAHSQTAGSLSYAQKLEINATSRNIDID
jgi:hypothetical protein